LKTAETATKLNRFDDPEDVILKNKLVRRMQHFVKDVNHKIKVGPVDTNTKIRTPTTWFAALLERVIDQLKLIEDALSMELQ
jgi:hypothetical protein